jgi:2-desacetyl-2-hydroxyethyl bacteriochlorophyllide A dehydrogenase
MFPKAFEVKLELADISVQPGADEILVETQYSLISPGTELALYTGTHIGLNDPANRFAKYPFYPGYAMVGKVIKTGSKAIPFAPGELIYGIGNHEQYGLLKWEPNKTALFRLPPQLDGKQAVFARLAAISVTALLRSRHRPGDTVVVLGLGLIGNLAAQLFSLSGCNVVGVDMVASRLECAKRCHISKVVQPGKEHSLKEQLRGLGCENPAIVVEATGVPQLVNEALELVSEQGQVVVLGSPRGLVEMNVYQYIHSKGVSLTGAHERLQGKGGLPSRYVLTEQMLKLIDTGALRIDPLITHVITADQAREGYELLLNQKDQTLGVLFRW